MTLNYSREDLEVLLSQAERLVRSSNCANLRGKESDDCSSDSDYETKASRDLLISSEPNLPLRRLSPNRRSRRDWRNSLPECLEFYKEQSDGRESPASQASLPLSELWEHDSFISEHIQDGAADNEKATLPSNLANFGEDYHKFLYSDVTDSDSSEDERSRERHSNTSYQILQSKSALKDLLIQLNANDDMWRCREELEEIEEVCQSNISTLREQSKQTDVKLQLKTFQRMISKWEDVSSEIRKGLQQHSELRNISEKIVTITEDLTTLDSIIDDDYDDELEEEDDEVADIKHQLFEQAKSHLLEISDSLLQLNLNLAAVRTAEFSQFPLHRPQVGEVESELGRVLASWQETHGKMSQAERRQQERKVCRQQQQFSHLVSHRLSRLVGAEQFVNTNQQCEGCDTSSVNKSASSLSRILRLGLVSGVVVVSVLSLSVLWSYNKCQNSYYHQIWPVLSFSGGPRPY